MCWQCSTLRMCLTVWPRYWYWSPSRELVEFAQHNMSEIPQLLGSLKLMANSGDWPTSLTRALNEANLLRSNGANWSAKASSLLKQRNQEPKKFPKHYSCINEVLSTNHFVSSFAPSCHTWLQFSEFEACFRLDAAWVRLSSLMQARQKAMGSVWPTDPIASNAMTLTLIQLIPSNKCNHA